MQDSNEVTKWNDGEDWSLFCAALCSSVLWYREAKPNVGDMICESLNMVG